MIAVKTEDKVLTPEEQCKQLREMLHAKSKQLKQKDQEIVRLQAVMAGQQIEIRTMQKDLSQYGIMCKKLDGLRQLILELQEIPLSELPSYLEVIIREPEEHGFPSLKDFFKKA
jgi:hypothetical protein